VIKLYSKSVGQGPPLLILHGLFGSSDNWQTFAKLISDRYRVITLDIRNHGLSPHTDDFSYELISSDILQFVEEEKLDSFFLMGHSMGGKAVAHFALHNPGRVSKLIILDISIKAYPPQYHIYFKAMLSMDLNRITTRTEADEWLKQDIPDVVVRQFILKNLVRNVEGLFRWKFNLDSLYKNYDNINAAIESVNPFLQPTLLISGEHSGYVKPEDFEQMKIVFPLITRIIIPQAGHWIHADQPVKLKEVLAEFLAGS